MEWNNKYISNMESKDRYLDNNNHKYKKDIILIAAFVIIAVIAFVVINHFVKKDGAFVQIKVDLTLCHRLYVLPYRLPQ